jgi:hypothetical protein
LDIWGHDKYRNGKSGQITDVSTVSAFSVVFAWFRYPYVFHGSGIFIFFPVLPLTEHHAMKAYWGVEVQLHAFF